MLNQGFPKGANLVSWEAKISKMAKGRATLKFWAVKILVFLLVIEYFTLWYNLPKRVLFVYLKQEKNLNA